MSYQDTWYPERVRHSASDVISTVVDDAPDYHDGELECMAARLNKCVEVMAAIVDMLPESDQQSLIAQVTGRWKLIEGDTK